MTQPRSFYLKGEGQTVLWQKEKTVVANIEHFTEKKKKTQISSIYLLMGLPSVLIKD